jgi:hypothetical protein
MDQIRALQIIALKEVLSENQSKDFQLRSIFRWYSKTFHTPLHVVEGLPEFDVLQAYFEDHYETLNNSNEGQGHIQKLLEDLSKTDEELLLEQKRKDEDDVWAYKEQQLAEKQGKDKDSGKLASNRRKAKEKLDRDKKVAKQIESLKDKDGIGTKLDLEKGANLDNISKLPVIPDFEMNFEGLDLGELGDLDANSSLTGVK